MNGIKSENLYFSCYIDPRILDIVCQQKPLGQLPQQLFSFHCKRNKLIKINGIKAQFPFFDLPFLHSIFKNATKVTESPKENADHVSSTRNNGGILTVVTDMIQIIHIDSSFVL